MSVLSKIKEFLDTLSDDEVGDGIGEPDLDGEQGIDGANIRPTDGPTDNADEVATGATDGGGDADEAGEGNDAGDTAPESEIEASELRDSAQLLGAENERLRNLLLDAGIDPDDTPLDDVVEDEAGAEPDEYDDDAAQADIDKQLADIEMLKK